MIQFFLECNAQTFISGVLILHSVSMSLCVCVTYLDSLESTAIAAVESKWRRWHDSPSMCSTMTSQCSEENTEEFTRNKLKLCSPVIHAKSDIIVH